MIENMIARRVAKGYNAIESLELLNRFLDYYSDPRQTSALISSLVYHEFATEAQAVKFTTK